MGELKAALQELPEHTDGQSARVGSSQHPAVAAPLGAPKMSPKHEHEPEIPPLLAKDGSCWICKLMCRIDDAADELAYVKGELAEANSAAERWYIAACPYGTPNALREALDLTKP